MSDNILFVDDDEHILAGFQRTLRKQYPVSTAAGGAAGLKLIQEQGAFAVVVSDMRMPEMDGVSFLAQVRALSPDSVRIMLTGQADMQDAIHAVNEGNIFRFLTKPCDNTILGKALDAALAQHHLIIAERELLEKTLNGSIKLLTDVLSLANPEAFSRAERIKRIVLHLSQALGVADAWQYELAAMFSQIGCVTLPRDILKKYHGGQSLAPDEKNLLASIPSISHDLLSNIPRLAPISQMIAWQNEPFKNFPANTAPQARKPTELGAQLLNVAVALDDLVTHQKLTDSQALVQLLEQPDLHDPALLEILKSAGGAEKKRVPVEIDAFDLAVDMIIAENIMTNKGVFLVGKGQEVTPTLIKFLNNYANRREIPDKIKVLTQQ